MLSTTATREGRTADATAAFDEAFDALAEARDEDAYNALRRSTLREDYDAVVGAILAVPAVHKSRVAARKARR